MTLTKLGSLAILAAMVAGSSIGTSTSSAALLHGGSVIVETDGEVVATFQGHSAGFTNQLFLDSPANALGILFTNQTTAVGTQVNLGSFTAGTELVFRMNVTDDGNNFFSGPASRNPDNITHAFVDDGLIPDETYVAFEDILGGGDLNFNDLTFSLTNTRIENIVPEPGALVLCGLGCVFAAMWRRAKRG
jgi:hypothetical protein